jgi:hypothetical protein
LWPSNSLDAPSFRAVRFRAARRQTPQYFIERHAEEVFEFRDMQIDPEALALAPGYAHPLGAVALDAFVHDYRHHCDAGALVEYLSRQPEKRYTVLPTGNGHRDSFAALQPRRLPDIPREALLEELLEMPLAEMLARVADVGYGRTSAHGAGYHRQPIHEVL